MIANFGLKINLPRRQAGHKTLYIDKTVLI
jgi:hypothetical protein